MIKEVSCTLIALSLLVPAAALAQRSQAPGRTSVAQGQTIPTQKPQQPPKQASTNLTVSGTLTLLEGKPTSGSHVVGMRAVQGTNVTAQSSNAMHVYVVILANYGKAIIETRVADAAPVKLGDFLNKNVTVTGTGSESGSPRVRRINIDKITAVTPSSK